jgi:hypothetical protein
MQLLFEKNFEIAQSDCQNAIRFLAAFTNRLPSEAEFGGYSGFRQTAATI